MVDKGDPTVENQDRNINTREVGEREQGNSEGDRTSKPSQSLESNIPITKDNLSALRESTKNGENVNMND